MWCLTWCTSYFFHCCDKIPYQNREVYFGSEFRSRVGGPERRRKPLNMIGQSCSPLGTWEVKGTGKGNRDCGKMLWEKKKYSLKGTKIDKMT